MTTATRGVSDHALIEAFEVAHQRFRRLGIDERQASRMSLYVSFRLSRKFNNAQAWEAVAEVLGPQTQAINARGDNEH